MYNFYCNLWNCVCVCVIMIMIIIYLHSCALFIRLKKFHIFLSTYLFIHKNGVLPKSFLWRLNVYTKSLAIHTHMAAWSIWPDYHYITWLAHGTSESKKKPAEKKMEMEWLSHRGYLFDYIMFHASLHHTLSLNLKSASFSIFLSLLRFLLNCAHMCFRSGNTITMVPMTLNVWTNKFRWFACAVQCT